MFYDAKKRVAKFLLLFYNSLKIPKRRSSALRFLFSSGILCILFVRRLPFLYFSPIYEAVNIVREERHETNHNRNIRYIFNCRQSPQNYQNDVVRRVIHRVIHRIKRTSSDVRYTARKLVVTEIVLGIMFLVSNAFKTK